MAMIRLDYGGYMLKLKRIGKAEEGKSHYCLVRGGMLNGWVAGWMLKPKRLTFLEHEGGRITMDYQREPLEMYIIEEDEGEHDEY